MLYRNNLDNPLLSGVGSVEGLAYVRINASQYLYWTSYTNSCISRIDVEDALANVTNKPEIMIQMTKLDHPRAIAIDACWEYVHQRSQRMLGEFVFQINLLSFIDNYKEYQGFISKLHVRF